MSNRQLNILLHQLRSVQVECEKGGEYWNEQWQHEFHLSRKAEIENFVDRYLKTVNLTDLIGQKKPLTPKTHDLLTILLMERRMLM